MGLSDCEKCWETPCCCGWEYREYTKEARIKQAAVVLGIDFEKLKNAIGDIVPPIHPKQFVGLRGMVGPCYNDPFTPNDQNQGNKT